MTKFKGYSITCFNFTLHLDFTIHLLLTNNIVKSKFDCNTYVIPISGGFSSVTSSASQSTELFDLSTNTWTPTPPLPRGAYFHVMLPVNDTHVVFLGGDGYFSDVNVFDRVSQMWSQLPPLPVARLENKMYIYYHISIFKLS